VTNGSEPPSGSRVYLDANVLVYVIENIAGYAAKVRPVFDRLGRDDLLGFSSELTLAEALVKPIAIGNRVSQD
jgi:hypothetical protein